MATFAWPHSRHAVSGWPEAVESQAFVYRCDASFKKKVTQDNRMGRLRVLNGRTEAYGTTEGVPFQNVGLIRGFPVAQVP
jgi:hypothetical protein